MNAGYTGEKMSRNGRRGRGVRGAVADVSRGHGAAVKNTCEYVDVIQFQSIIMSV